MQHRKTKSDARHYASVLTWDAQEESEHNWKRMTLEGTGLDSRRIREPDNYKEVIIQVPQLRKHHTKKLPTAEMSLWEHFGERVTDMNEDIKQAAVHYRTSDYEINGEKYLLIQEIQSDYFQDIQKVYHSLTPAEVRNFIDKTPYAGTNHWVALAFRHALDDAVKKGDYKGIAWLDGRTQTRLEKGYDPRKLAIEPAPILFGNSYVKFKVTPQGNEMKITVISPSGAAGTSIKQVSTAPTNKMFIKFLDDGGHVFSLRDKTIESLVSLKIGKDKILDLVEGKDYVTVASVDNEYKDVQLKRKYVVFKKGVIKDQITWDDSMADGMVKFKSGTKFDVTLVNQFAVFQDKIVTSAISKQMKRNGLEPKIMHDKKLGLHVMPISNSSQRLILERGQPKYAPVKTLELPKKEFDLLQASEAPSRDMLLDKYKARLLETIAGATSSPDLRKALKDIVC